MRLNVSLVYGVGNLDVANSTLLPSPAGRRDEVSGNIGDGGDVSLGNGLL
jgi:hypothetical protein